LAYSVATLLGRRCKIAGQPRWREEEGRERGEAKGREGRRKKGWEGEWTEGEEGRGERRVGEGKEGDGGRIYKNF